MFAPGRPLVLTQQDHNSCAFCLFRKEVAVLQLKIDCFFAIISVVGGLEYYHEKSPILNDTISVSLPDGVMKAVPSKAKSKQLNGIHLYSVLA